MLGKKYLLILLIPSICWAIDSGPNSSYLADTKWGTEQFNILGAKLASVKQNYEDRVRNYNLYQTYGLNDYNSQYNYYSSMTGFHSDTFHDIYHAVYTTQVSQYVQNVKTSNKNGDISKPIQVTGGVISVLTGNANTLKLGDDSKIVTKTDIPNQYSEVKLEDKAVNIFVNYNQKNPISTTGAERAQAGLNKSLPLKFTESVTYGISSTTTRNTIVYDFGHHIGLYYDYIIGNSDIPSENIMRSGYSLKF